MGFLSVSTLPVIRDRHHFKQHTTLLQICYSFVNLLYITSILILRLDIY